MVKKPAFKLLSDKKDITPLLAANILSLTYEDKKDDETDEISFTVQGLYNNKPFGTNVELQLGFEGAPLVSYGNFTIQTIRKDYVNNTTEVRATAADFTTVQKVKRTRTWERTTLPAIIIQIATENKMGYQIHDEAKKHYILSATQVGWTDLAWLSELVRKKGFYLKVWNNAIIVSTTKPEPTPVQSPAAPTRPEKQIQIKNLYSLNVTEANRDMYGTVAIRYHDERDNSYRTHHFSQLDGNIVAHGEQIVQGKKNTIYDIEIPRPKTDAELSELAYAKLFEMQKGEKEGSFEAEGQDIRTGDILSIEKVGKITVTSVSHLLTPSGYTITVDFEG
jgi:phage protein D